MMDQTTAWLLAPIILAIAIGIYLRRRYGNPYARFSEAVKRATGIGMETIVRAIAVLTLVGWGVVYVISAGDPDTGLDELFGWLAGRSEGVSNAP